MAVRSQHNLRDHMVVFCRALREAGIPVGPAAAIDALQVLQRIALTDRQRVRQTLQMIFAKHPEEIQIFQRVFKQYWDIQLHAAETKEVPEDLSLEAPPDDHSLNTAPFLKKWFENAGTPVADSEVHLPGYSPMRVVMEKDFAHFSATEQAEILALVRRLARRLAVQFSRRMRTTHRQLQLDFRKTLRRNLRRGGEMLQLQFKERTRRRLKLVVLCDVSKSMDLYAQFLLQFLLAFATVYHRTEIFVFSTSLAQLSSAIREFQLHRDLRKVFAEFREWSGGTRIGESFQQFVRTYGDRLDSRTVVLILSDGWDTGDITLLKESMATIHRKSAWVIWLNPLMGFTQYRPETRGMQAALPFIDVLAPVHNLESLRQLVEQLLPVAHSRSHAGLRRHYRSVNFYPYRGKRSES